MGGWSSKDVVRDLFIGEELFLSICYVVSIYFVFVFENLDFERWEGLLGLYWFYGWRFRERVSFI